MGERGLTTTTGAQRRSPREHGQSMGERTVTTTHGEPMRSLMKEGTENG